MPVQVLTTPPARLGARCDEATGYLARIVGSYDELRAVEVFAREDALVEDVMGRRLLASTGGALPASVGYLPMSKDYRVVGKDWGSELLQEHLRRWYAWVWLNSTTPYAGTFATQPGGCFAASAAQIRRRPLAFWRHLLAVTGDPLLSSFTDTSRDPSPSRRRFCFYGHMLELMWGVSLGQPPKGPSHRHMYKDLKQSSDSAPQKPQQSTTASKRKDDYDRVIEHVNPRQWSPKWRFGVWQNFGIAGG